jgi:succinoglycan biosynthesis transport protein ExoP
MEETNLETVPAHMHEQQYLLGPELPKSRSTATLRDIVAVGFRHRRLFKLSFAGMLLGAVLAALLAPKTYEAELRILVKNERLDPVVSPEPLPSSNVDTEEILNSEVELLSSDDLLQRVVTEVRPHQRLRGLFGWKDGNQNDPVTVATEARRIAHDLKIEPVRKTNIIRLSYTNSDPKIAASVLNTLARLYIDKHLQVYRTSGQYNLFAQLSEGYRKQLLEAEAKLSNSGNVAANLTRDLVVQKYNQLNGDLAQLDASIKETRQRISMLEEQQKATPARVLTQLRSSDNQQLLQQLKSTLLTLELKRAELLTRFQPTYRLVQEVDQQIAETRATIQKEESAPARDQTTDENPTRVWINSELAKARAELAGLQARAAAMGVIVQGYGTKAQVFEKEAITENDVQRTAKTAEENYLLYARKAEEARISEASAILDVGIAEPATAPLLPSRSRFRYLLVGCVLAVVGSVSLVFAAELLDSSYRTPDEVTSSLRLPVFAVVPLLASGDEQQHARQHPEYIDGVSTQ